MVNSIIGLRTRAVTAVFLLCSSTSALAGLTGSPNPNTGDYTISWSAISITQGIDDGYRLLESTNGGASWSSTYYAYGLSKSFANKAAGTYTYKLKRCALVTQWGEPMPQCNDSGFGNISVSVTDPSLPVAAPYHEQLQYEYEVRSGDFDFDGFADILVDRLTPGLIDGSMQTVIIEGGVGGQTVVIPTSSELANARTFPLNSDIKLGGSDQNFDGYVDILLMGLDALNSPAFPYDCLILFASGKSGVAQPLGHQFMDEDYMEFFSNTAEAAVNPSFYLNNIQVTYRPEYDMRWDCEWRFIGHDFSLYDCRWRIGIVAYTPQVSGYGYHLDAPAATDALNAIDSVDFSQGNPWLQLSNAMKNVLGVNSFGYQDDGSRNPTNYKRNGDTEEDEYGSLRSRLWFNMWRAYFEANAESVDPQDYDRHVYDVNSAICSTLVDTTVAMRAITGVLGTTGTETIPKEICTVENVFCWAKRNPAPRENDSEATIMNGDDSVLKGGNPIRTHVFDPVFAVVNETLPAGVIPGVQAHMLHDPLQIENCGNHPTSGEINQNSPRCAYVHRQVELSASGSQVLISTHGEGHNAPLNRALNEFGGKQIFNDVDIWVRQKMATDGACTDD
ncbi:MAG: hypothetical protein IID59_01780 [Proteobacteria bacterium]|nr:hypothetical protein [Pseudomonadota bacterium]